MLLICNAYRLQTIHRHDRSSWLDCTRCGLMMLTSMFSVHLLDAEEMFGADSLGVGLG